MGQPEVAGLKMMNNLTPIKIYLRLAETVIEAWGVLDAKYGNVSNALTIFINDFYKVTLKSKSDESKMVELLAAVQHLHINLVEIGQLVALDENVHLLSQIVWMMPKYWWRKWTDDEEQLMLGLPVLSHWKALHKYLKDEVKKIKTKAPWELDDYEGDNDNSCLG